ncbi:MULTISPECIES: DUF6083 domain-containing protein [unclassified Streptomyces]|uniref:DUF6083 domain-containing protein n=1 Tax=unclassified Streptomyces TaxID=2593676 RepID=UPI0035DE6054
MRSTPPSAARHWDSSPIAVRPRRLLQISPDGASRLLRCGQRDRCRECGNGIEWYHRGTGPHRRLVRLHPGELPAARVPTACRWHVSSGVAYPAGDGGSWCRLLHAVLCPARDADPASTDLAGLRRALAVTTRRLIDCGAFSPSPAPDRPAPAGAAAQVCRPARPVVQLLYVRYLASRPVEEIRCTAQTRRRDRCTSPLLTPGAPAGAWRLMPVTTAGGQLALPADMMAVYDLGRLPYAEQLCWRAQRCPQHAALPTAADLAVADWEPFDPLRHHEHVHARLPTGGRRPGPHGRVRQAVRP